MINMIGLFWGRFNPPHKGHLQMIKKILRTCDKLIIVIGSAEFKNTKRNPFDGNERARMMKAYLKEDHINLRRVKVIPVPDGKSYYSSTKNILKLCPKFDILYTDKEIIIRILGKRSRIKRIKRMGAISSTKIRDAIANNKRWEHLTGKTVVKLIKKLDGIERIKTTYQ